jgi:putative ABC transport system permease protein
MQEVGLMKAIGADHSSILLLFVSEATVLGLLGGTLGYGLGMIFAQVIAHSTFGSGLGWSPLVFVLALLVAVLVAVAGSIYPIRLALGFEPREVLHRA